LLATALVRPARDGGTVLAVGPSRSRALQALTRVDPVGFAERELADRTETDLPPAVRLAVAQGEWAALTELAEAIADVPGASALGPALLVAAEDDEQLARLVIRAPLPSGPALADALRAFTAGRSARKDQRPLRIKVDPADVG
jgi:primosomal protein N' (replication factor Y)